MYFWGKHIGNLEESLEEKIRIIKNLYWGGKKDRRARDSFIMIKVTISFIPIMKRKKNSGKMI